MLAAVFAIVCVLVPDPVTVARAPSAYVPLDDALFTPVGELGLPSADGSPVALFAPADTILDGPFGHADLSAAGAPPARPAKVVPPHVGQVPVGWRTTQVSWYGPGFYGRRTACGAAMTQTLVGVAHRTLPCGTLVEFRWHGRTIKAPVVDRGPYVAGRLWDLTPGLCALLDHCFTGPISWKVN